MTEQDEQDLRELQAELVSAERSPWEPRCVARAFRSAGAEDPFVFTMQAWIDLDAVQSPFLLRRMPEADADLWPHFSLAFRAFGYHGTTPDKCDPEELVLLGRKMIAAIREGFAMRTRLEPPEGVVSPSSPDNGTGDWLPTLACLVSQIGLSMQEARTCPVGQAFALICGHRVNQGWTVTAGNYAHQDIADEEDD